MTIRALSLAALSLAATALPAAAQETRSSAATKLDSEFAQSDTNHDGFLSRAEVVARMRKMKVGGGKDLDATHAERVADLFIARADTNHDGKISEAESQALMAKVFSRYDLNHDGKVDGQEAALARAAAKKAAAGKK